jgi:AraC family transcriptional regulator of arabinose operon
MHDRSNMPARRLMNTKNMDSRIARAIARIESELHEASVECLAREAELSRSRFSHLFRREVGVSPARFLHRRRMELALVLLERTSLPVREVMWHVGCHDPSHFARDFRRFHGFSPRERRMALGASREIPTGVSS